MCSSCSNQLGHRSLSKHCEPEADVAPEVRTTRAGSVRVRASLRSRQPGGSTQPASESVVALELMKVIVDLSNCDLHGLCVEAAPEVFEIDDNGVLKVLIEAPPEDLRAKVEKAVRECPTGAITIQE